MSIGLSRSRFWPVRCITWEALWDPVGQSYVIIYKKLHKNIIEENMQTRKIITNEFETDQNEACLYNINQRFFLIFLPNIT